MAKKSRPNAVEELKPRELDDPVTQPIR